MEEYDDSSRIDATKILTPSLTGEMNDVPGFSKDTDWIRQSFIAPFTGDTRPKISMDPIDERNQFFSTAAVKVNIKSNR